LIPNIGSRDLKRMLKRMGIDVEELENVENIVINLKDREIIIEEPQVIVMKTQGQTIYQITGKVSERAKEESKSFSEEDIEFVISQTGVSREKALDALRKAGGDLAEAILLIREGKV